MAGSISFFNKPPIAITNNLRTTKVIFASLSIPSPPSKPSKLAKRRRNTLRPKILTKPYSPPRKPVETPTEPLETLAPPAEQSEATVAVVSAESDVFPVEVSAGSVARYGLYLIVGFVFQTVLAVWVLGNSDSGRKDQSLDGLDSDKEMVLLNGNRNGIEKLGEKLEEIRVLARNARKNEKSDNGDPKSRSKIGVEREVGNRLLKLRKSLNSSREKLPGSYVNHLSKLGDDSEPKMGNESLVFKKKFRAKSYSVEFEESPKGFGGSEKMVENEEVDSKKLSLEQNGQKKFVGQKEFGGLDKNEEKMVETEGIDSEKLSLKQNGQTKFVGSKGIGGLEKNEEKMVQIEGINSEKMSFTRDGRKKLVGPKGFGGSEKSKALRRKERGERVEVDGSVGKESMSVLEVENEGIGKARLMQNGRKKLEGNEKRRVNEDKEGSPTSKSKNGVIQEGKHKRPSGRDSIVEGSDESYFLSRNESSRLNKAVKKPESRKAQDKRSEIETDMWWLDLPYVLVVVMQRAFDPTELVGLYTLTIEDEADTKDEYSYTVAFEDRVDATNFCFLLESFFEDLGDVITDIAPMSIKEVQEAIKSQNWNVIVVKKGQLKLYAGQPFEEVEMALRALVEET